MNRIARGIQSIRDFYALQLRVARSWQAGRGALLRRTILSFALSFVALVGTVAIMPGITAPSVGTLILATLALGALNLVLRPLFLALFAAIAIIAVAVGTLVFQAIAFLVVSAFVPEFHVGGFVTSVVGSFVYGALVTILTAVVGVNEDESYWGALVQQLASQRSDVTRTDAPGVVIVQIDGLAHPILAHQVRAGRVPFISSLIRDRAMTLSPWEALLPSQTSASQAGILHGNNSFIPAFRWYEKERGHLMVSNHPEDAAEIVRRASNGEGLLSNDGASVGNLVSGDAPRSYITMATIRDPNQGLGQSQAFYSFFLSSDSYLRSIVQSIGEIVKEYVQARRQAGAGIAPRMHRGMPYPLARAATNVLLRALSTSLVMEEMYRGAPVIYVDFTDYDEIAHHSGPERGESLDALDGVDRALATLVRSAADAPRPYRFVVLSDHGQSLGATFRQRYGVTLQELIAERMGGPAAVRAATERVEEWGQVNAFLSETSRVDGATGALTRAAFRNQTENGVIDVAPEARPDGRAAGERPDVVVCASGNLALVCFPRLAGRLPLERIEAEWPGLVDGLANHPGIGVVMVRSDEHGALAVGRRGIRFLDEDRVQGDDPVAVYGGRAIDGLRRVDGMEHCGDLVAISRYDQDAEEVAAFEELIGSHGGLGGPQTRPFILHPADWPITEPLVGAEAVYRQVRAWLEAVGIGLGPGGGGRDVVPLTPVVAGSSDGSSGSGTAGGSRRRRRARSPVGRPNDPGGRGASRGCGE